MHHLSTLYLAYRQAKIALFFEGRGIGLIDLAQFEHTLPDRLAELQRTLANNGGWFDGIPLGDCHVVPKKVRQSQSNTPGVSRHTPPDGSTIPPDIDIQVRLTPTPEFAIVEALFLWRFGPALDALLSPEVLGYRMDVRKGRIREYGRWLFEYWPPKYQQFRTEPMRIADNAVASRGELIEIVSADLQSFYDTINPNYLLGDSFVESVARASYETESPFSPQEFASATQSLLAAYRRYHAHAGRITGLDWVLGVPIGCLTSRIVANTALITLDDHIRNNSDVLCYRRYVDDFVIIGRHTTELGDQASYLAKYLPLERADDSQVLLNVERLQRPASELSLQTEKCRVHVLGGSQGREFLKSVQDDFTALVSERRAFLDHAIVDGDIDRDIVRAGTDDGEKVRVLRDADRVKINRLSLSTALSSLDRIALLVDSKEVREAAERTIERAGTLAMNLHEWVTHVDLFFRLLQLSISAGAHEQTRMLIETSDKFWGSAGTLATSVGHLYHRNRRISHARARLRMRDYLHGRRLEAIASSLLSPAPTRSTPFLPSSGLKVKTKHLGHQALFARARRLAEADLRKWDREDDAFARPDPLAPWSDERIRHSDSQLDQRLTRIRQFVDHCEELDDRIWARAPARLFLSTRPPSYFDIARRWLYRIESRDLDTDIFHDLLIVVNAVRGTDYHDPVGRVVGERAVSLPAPTSNPATEPSDPKLILGNLVIPDEAVASAATVTNGSKVGQPVLSLSRLLGVARILERSYQVARRSHRSQHSLLVLPELSVPRSWFRAISRHVIRTGKLGLVAGLEYLHDPVQPHVFNQVYAVLPGPCDSVATWPWTKRRPARVEEHELAKAGVSFSSYKPDQHPRIVVDSPFGLLSVLICSELIEARRVADLLGRVELVVSPSWNQDTASYGHLIQSAGLQLHAVIAIANNGHYSDCRVWAPRRKRWQRDLCRLIERDANDIVYVEIPLLSLRKHHNGANEAHWRPLPPGWHDP